MRNQIVWIDLFGYDGSILELTTDHNESYLVIVKSKYDTLGFLIEPTVRRGMALNRLILDRDNRLRGDLEWAIVYPAAYESDLKLTKAYGLDSLFKAIEARDFAGDDKYSLGHLRLMNQADGR